jgi:hypothetical protein
MGVSLVSGILNMFFMLIIIIFVADCYFNLFCNADVILSPLKPVAIVLGHERKRYEITALEKDVFEH